MPRLELEVAEVRQETPTIRSVRLSLSGKPFPFKPGQYCLVELSVGEGRGDHTFSIASSPTRPGSLLFATRQSPSAYKQRFFQLKPGDGVAVTGPVGRFVYDETAEHTVLLSGGIGITPLKSMLEYARDRGIDRPINLLYGNRTPAEIAFRQELDALAAAHPTMNVVHVVSQPEGAAEPWRGRTGRINEALIREVVPRPDRARYYICGPPGMVAGLRGVLAQMAVPEANVRIENFEGYD
jgi:ferredoxin-NADP reductase